RESATAPPSSRRSGTSRPAPYPPPQVREERTRPCCGAPTATIKRFVAGIEPSSRQTSWSTPGGHGIGAVAAPRGEHPDQGARSLDGDGAGPHGGRERDAPGVPTGQ